MPRYAITEKAGRFVAGQNNTGVGAVLTLTEKQAEHEVRLGTLQLLDGKKAAPTKGKKAAKGTPKADGGGDASGATGGDPGGDKAGEGAQ
ncbi:hypothetical protein [Roseovarius sp. SYSU LYC5161]|uniref:hypothetical protein n=1 Tax=Roseovarius halophilus (ex Wu et al. 2025) TaxID=3376060 RepID=UPI00399BB6B0